MLPFSVSPPSEDSGSTDLRPFRIIFSSDISKNKVLAALKLKSHVVHKVAHISKYLLLGTCNSFEIEDSYFPALGLLRFTRN